MLRAVLLGIFLSISAHADAAWNISRSDHFTIYSEDSPEKLRRFAEDLERFDAGMRLLRNIPQFADSPSNRLTIFLLGSTSEVAQLYGKGGSYVAGFYVARAGRSFAVVPRRGGLEEEDLTTTNVLLHEYGHHFLARQTVAALPAWLKEGLSEFGSTTKFADDGSIEVGRPAVHRAAELMGGPRVSIADLLSGSFRGLHPDQLATAYGQGWLLTHFLTFTDTRQGQLVDYLKRMNAGEDPVAAARAAFGDIKRLGIELQKYLTNNRFRYLRIPAESLKIGPVSVEPLSAGASAMMPVYMRVRRGAEGPRAAELATRARAIAALHPDDAFVQLALAEALLGAGDAAAAEQAAERALAAEPKSVAALIARGSAALARLAEAAKAGAPAPDAAQWDGARRWLLRANRIEPDSPETLMLFHRSFRMQGIEPPANAADALYRAAELAPEDRLLRLVVAAQYLAAGRPAEARRALATSANDPHPGQLGAFAGRLIEAIDGNRPGEAARLAAMVDGTPASQADEGAGESTEDGAKTGDGPAD